MGWLDWLFGEEEEERNPEFLVLGAKLKCIYGSTNSYLYIDSDNMNINNLPEACVSDSQARYNILPFGQCVMGGPCSAMMKIEEEWYNPKPQTKEVNGKEAITTDSTLICAATGMLIEAVSSGQDGVFANQLLFMQEMDVLYPGLRELLEDPYGSLYLKDGMYELGIQFLQDRMEANGGSIEIFAMDTQNSLEASYITAAFERLLPYVDTRAPGSFFDGLQTVICKAEVENGADAHLLNADLIEVLQADCGDYAKKVSDGGYYKYQEEHKMFLNWLGEASMSMAYGVMVYQSLVNWKPGPKNVYESKNEGNGGGKIESEAKEGESESGRIPRPGDDNFIGPLTNSDNHFIRGDGIGPKKRGVLGAHNMNCFDSTLESTGFPLEDLKVAPPTPDSTIEGIYTQQYRVPAYDGRGNFIGFKNIPDPKTIYDPAIISNRQMLDWGQEAMQNGVITGRIIEGTASNGLQFRGFIEDGVVTNFFPVLPQ